VTVHDGTLGRGDDGYPVTPGRPARLALTLTTALALTMVLTVPLGAAVEPSGSSDDGGGASEPGVSTSARLAILPCGVSAAT
jgi:hypothetical protein